MLKDIDDFYGQCWAFPPKFYLNQTPQVAMVSGIKAIEQSLKVLFLTEAGERIMREAYGGGLNDFIFSNVTDELLAKITSHIEDNILRYEPRVKINSIHINPAANKASQLWIQIAFSLVGSEIIKTIAGNIDLHDIESLRLI